MSTDLVRWIGKTFWGSEEAADFSTYEGKALAAKKIQDREYAKESLILCDFAWPIKDVDCSEDHKGDPTIENRIYSAVTGRETDEAGLNTIGERVFNLQRAILTREGRVGRGADRIHEMFYTVPLQEAFLNPECLVLGQGEETISRKGAVVDREQFEAMKTEYYQLRGWDPVTGLQTKSKLHQLGLDDVAVDLGVRKVLALSN
jgi:aldehyde:ferredoxin oxidoreductase